MSIISVEGVHTSIKYASYHCKEEGRGSHKYKVCIVRMKGGVDKYMYIVCVEGVHKYKVCIIVRRKGGVHQYHHMYENSYCTHYIPIGLHIDN